ncbi:MAG TPA: dTMP kinase [Solirubrobacteraceae bacterium]|jgi:dTMP kinase|nr:dTMP kinase [Solirubrobacteraceae bacterium]
MRGRLVSIEGVDGAGKSTLARTLAERLAADGAPVELLREPGGVEVAERLRALVTDPQLEVDARAEALIYAAARAQLVHERLRPLLEQGRFVLIDRFVDSSLAYQGAGRGLGVDAVAEINRFASGGLTPDLTLLLRVPPELGRERLGGREAQRDRLEREGADFFSAVCRAYDVLAETDSARFRVIDARAAPEVVLEAALEAVRSLLHRGM